MIKIIKAKHQHDFEIRLYFSDGASGDYDVAPLIAKNTVMTQPLTAPSFFRDFFIEMGALCWKNGFELSASGTYQTLFEIGKLHKFDIAAYQRSVNQRETYLNVLNHAPNVPEADWEAKEEFPEDKHETQPRLGELAVGLFGTVAGIELDLPRHPPHEPLEFGR